MSRQAPREIADLALARATAREARDWGLADRLRAEIEAAGWSIVDRGTRYTLRPAHVPDLVDGEVVRYGHSLGVPSRLPEPVSAPVTVILVADDRPDAVAGVLGDLRAGAQAGAQVVIVADDPTPAQAAALTGPTGVAAGTVGGVEPEVIWTSARLGRPVALNAGLRRAVGAAIVVIGADGARATGATVDLVAALEDPTVAIAGLRGLVTTDLRRFTDTPAGEATVVSGTIAFRRDDLIARGPLEERFLTARGLDAWWSLTLRDGGDPGPPRRALAVGSAVREPADAERPDEASRPVRRDFYRLRDGFGDRPDLLAVEYPDPEPLPA